MREIEQVLANWIREALSPEGQIPEGVEPTTWIAEQFLRWWETKGIKEPLDEADGAEQWLRSELEGMGGRNNPQLEEIMHQMIYLREALDELRALLGLPEDE